jgi:hypothetical protein
MVKVIPILDDYQTKIWNLNFNNEREQLSWMHKVEKGFIHKETVETWAITNLRAVKLYSASVDNPKPRIEAVGLAIADTIVMNQYRNSTGSRVGTFIGALGEVYLQALEKTLTQAQVRLMVTWFFFCAEERSYALKA